MADQSPVWTECSLLPLIPNFVYVFFSAALGAVSIDEEPGVGGTSA